MLVLKHVEKPKPQNSQLQNVRKTPDFRRCSRKKKNIYYIYIYIINIQHGNAMLNIGELVDNAGNLKHPYTLV